MVFHHKNPCNCVVLAPFSEHLSAPGNYNILIYSIFKSHADSDRCFSTFIFLHDYAHTSIIPSLRSIKRSICAPRLFLSSSGIQHHAYSLVNIPLMPSQPFQKDSSSDKNPERGASIQGNSSRKITFFQVLRKRTNCFNLRNGLHGEVVSAQTLLSDLLAQLQGTF